MLVCVMLVLQHTPTWLIQVCTFPTREQYAAPSIKTFMMCVMRTSQELRCRPQCLVYILSSCDGAASYVLLKRLRICSGASRVQRGMRGDGVCGCYRPVPC